MPRWVESAPKNLRWARVETTARVRWSECDFQGHAYYGSYVPWCDLGREALGLAVGVDYQKYMFTTTEFHVRYHTSARYLDELYRQFGDWALALAAYTQGQNFVRKAIEREKTRDAWELIRRGALDPYPAKVMAAALVIADPSLAGI